MTRVKSVSSFSRGAQGSPKFYKSCQLLLLNLKKKTTSVLECFVTALTLPNMFVLLDMVSFHSLILPSGGSFGGQGLQDFF